MVPQAPNDRHASPSKTPTGRAIGPRAPRTYGMTDEKRRYMKNEKSQDGRRTTQAEAPKLKLEGIHYKMAPTPGTGLSDPSPSCSDTPAKYKEAATERASCSDSSNTLRS